MNQTSEDIARSHRLRCLADMAGGMAHEFNQPLTVIRGCAENLLIARQRGWQLPPERIDDKLALIVAQCDRISSLIDEVRRFARGAEDFQIVPMHPAESLADALRLLRVQLAAHGIDVSIDDQTAGRRALGDRHAFADVLVELLRNAREAIIGSGRAHGRIAITLLADDDACSMTLVDDGPGMDAAATVEAFEPFHRGGPGAGPGLGLAIARRTMEALGGSLTVSSQIGHGTAITLRLRPTDA